MLVATLLIITSVLAGQPVQGTAPSKSPGASPAASKAQPPAPHADRLSVARAQTLLARAGFSPGLIDGRFGRKTRIAIEHYQRALGHEPTGELSAVEHASPAEWTRPYAITEQDLAQITGPVPEDWNIRAELAFCGYADMPDLLAERGWCSVDLVTLLNPDKPLADLAAGDVVILPDTSAKPLPKLARVEINLAEKLVLGHDDAGTVVFLTHCSIAKDIQKRPVGDLKVAVLVENPDYTFNPDLWPDVTNVASKLRIAPGPRNPVGVAWIGLDRPGYGVHGTVRPQDIGKTGSLGCFRLTNWDAARLLRALKVGTPVTITE